MKRLVFLVALVAGCGSETTNVTGPTRTISDSAQVVSVDVNLATSPRTRVVVTNEGPNQVYDVRFIYQDDDRLRTFETLVAPVLAVDSVDTIWIVRDTTIGANPYSFRGLSWYFLGYSL